MFKLDRFRIAARLNLGFFIVIFLALVIGVSSLLAMGNLADFTKKLYRHPLAVSNAALSIESINGHIEIAINEMLLAHRLAEIEAAATHIKELDKQLLGQFKIIKERFLGDQSKISALQDKFIEGKTIINKIEQLLRDGERLAAEAVATGELARYEGELDTDIAGLITFAQNKAQEFLARAEAKRTQTTQFSIALLLGMIVISVFVAVMIARSITRPLAAVSELIEQLANCNLRANPFANIPKDEVGDLQRSYNGLLASLKNLVGSMQENSIQLQATSTELLATSQGQQTGAVQQAAAVEETKQALDSLLSSANQVATVSQDVFNNAEVSQKNATVIAGRIGELSNHTERIGEILTLIKEIANKSDLLALNAALEGTKAGEAGRGFSLVANQMQRLSEQVMGSVKNIESLTSDISKATSSSVLATEEANKLAAQTTTSARTITRSVQQQQVSTQEAATAMEEVSAVAQEAAAASGNVVEAANQLTQLAQGMNSAVSKYSL